MLAELDHAGIAARVPHTGRMCLLDRVLYWDERSLRCAAISHLHADNPMREAAGLAALAGIEYAAQAAAVHSALVHGTAEPRSGVLAALKNVTAVRPWLPETTNEIIVEVTLLHRDPAGGIFAFTLFAESECVLSGQFTLMYIDHSDQRDQSHEILGASV